MSFSVSSLVINSYFLIDFEGFLQFFYLLSLSLVVPLIDFINGSS